MAEAVQERRGREGGRWINERPSSAEFAEWFKESMKIDEALRVEDYIGGVVLIPAVDTKVKTVTGFQNGAPIIEQREELSYVPYAKVESRIDYFWDLMEAREDRVGVVERLTAPRLSVEPQLVKQDGELREYKQPSALAQMAYQLPDGFSLLSVSVGERYSHFLCCTTKVSIYRADGDGSPKGPPVREGIGTKQVPLVIGYSNNLYADASSLMKAETGSLGRALGFAGIFIIPGSGVATAEDMLDAAEGSGVAPQAAPTEGQGPAAPTAPPARTGAEQAQDEEAQLKQRALDLFKQLKEEKPGKVEEFTSWAHERKLSSLSEATGPALRGVVKRLEKLNDEEEADVPAATTAEEGSDGTDSSPEAS